MCFVFYIETYIHTKQSVLKMIKKIVKILAEVRTIESNKISQQFKPKTLLSNKCNPGSEL